MERKYNKEEFKELKAIAKANSIRFFTEDVTDDGYTYNGISIAWTPCVENTDCRMIAVAVSYCAPEDEFKPKHGKFHALNKLLSGQYVQVPLGSYHRNCGNKALEETLLSMFLI